MSPLPLIKHFHVSSKNVALELIISYGKMKHLKNNICTWVCNFWYQHIFCHNTTCLSDEVVKLSTPGVRRFQKAQMTRCILASTQSECHSLYVTFYNKCYTEIWCIVIQSWLYGSELNMYTLEPHCYGSHYRANCLACGFEVSMNAKQQFKLEKLLL